MAMDDSLGAQRTLPQVAPAIERAPHPAHHWALLILGALAVSTASVLIRLAEAPALVVGAWRILLAATMLTPWAWPRFGRERGRLERRELLCLVLAGTALALHFASWISSLSFTTVASSVILVSTNPIYVGLASHFVLHEPINRRKLLAIVVVMIGSVVVSYGDLRLSGRAFWGDLLAVLGALMGSAYILLGRTVRRRLTTLAYVWPCYGLAGVLLVSACLISGQPLIGYDARTYLLFALMALVPQILGHSTFNWALGHFSPLFVTLALLGEPVGASLLAWLILGEVPPPSAFFGGLLILGGIYLASRQEMIDDQA
jgi:drug/metabolite transporter (DMT)-like permease